MSDNTDTDYIEDKKNAQDSSSSKSTPNYIGFVTDIIKYMIQALILFSISAGFIFTINNPEYRDADGDVTWPGTDINLPPYGEVPTTGGTKNSIKSTIKDLFDLSKFGSPYNLQAMKIMINKQKQLDDFNKTNPDGSGESPEIAGLSPQAQLFPWAIRMTAISYSWMRTYFEAGLISAIGDTDNHKYATWINSIIFTLGWAPLLFISFLMFFISPAMTVVGALLSFNPWVWVGFPGLGKLFLMFFFPGLLYLLALFFVPFFTAMFNAYVQPLFYIGFLLEPIFKNFGAVKNIMLSHSHLIGIIGILITVISAISNSINAPGFIIGVVIMAAITIGNGPAKKHITDAASNTIAKVASSK